MPVPDYQTFMLPLLEHVAGEAKTFKAVCELLAGYFKLTATDKAETIPSGLATYISRIGWARSYMKQAGLVESPSKGVIQITERGKQVLAQKPAKIDVKFLMQFPDFVAFKNRAKPKTAVVSLVGLLPLETPEEILEKTWGEINEALSAELLDKAKQMPPALFERLVVDLMLAMGYGGSREDAGKTVGRSGDGGIDGIINEDRLGLEVIYLQAKRWKESVGSPTVQGFIGSLVNNGATKGVLITTSTFTEEAQKTARKNPQYKIILIDGKRMASLMIEYNLGVSLQETYVVKKVDQDYFDQIV